MKILSLSIMVFFLSFGNLSAQNVPGIPNGALGKDTRDDYDNGIRLRSIELERIKRSNSRKTSAREKSENYKINYLLIKKDFEKLQKLQDEVIKTFLTGKQINYGRIGELASELNGCAERLYKNLLLPAGNAEPLDFEITISKAVRDLIVELDNNIGVFVNNPIFQNLNTIETKNAEKAEIDLQSIISLSNILARKSDQLK